MRIVRFLAIALVAAALLQFAAATNASEVIKSSQGPDQRKPNGADGTGSEQNNNRAAAPQAPENSTKDLALDTANNSSLDTSSKEDSWISWLAWLAFLPLLAALGFGAYRLRYLSARHDDLAEKLGRIANRFGELDDRVTNLERLPNPANKQPSPPPPIRDSVGFAFPRGADTHEQRESQPPTGPSWRDRDGQPTIPPATPAAPPPLSRPSLTGQIADILKPDLASYEYMEKIRRLSDDIRVVITDATGDLKLGGSLSDDAIDATLVAVGQGNNQWIIMPSYAYLRDFGVNNYKLSFASPLIRATFALREDSNPGLAYIDECQARCEMAGRLIIEKKGVLGGYKP